MVDPARPRLERIRWTFVPRIASSLFCAVVAVALGLAHPFVWYWMWKRLQRGAFGHEYPLLVPLIVATAGVIGGGTIGLVVGAVAPVRLGLTLSLVGLALVQIAVGVYFGSAVLTLITFPAVGVNCALALLCCLPRWKRAHPE